MRDGKLERRALDLLENLLQLEPAQRQVQANRHCGDDSALRVEVMELLQAASAAQDDFLEEPAFDAWDWDRDQAMHETPQPAKRFGNFRVIEPLGEGGMGKVWLAIQERPIRRRVAVKVVRLHGRQARRRFAVECQALAKLSHPNVATLYEVGETDAGEPFVAMELLEGPDLCEYCDRRRLPLRARLELFLRVCAAVSHAHEKGILHRDLKPSNVLVTEVDGQPVPKVIDFGIAQIFDGPFDSRQASDERMVVGSPAYMSPEAFRGAAAVDTRSDVYSLGLLLYELLTGALPLAAHSRLDAPVPSQHLRALPPFEQGQIASRRGLEPTRLGRRLRGDLDAIVGCAIAYRPEARYAQPADLAADLARHLEARPVAARPATWSDLASRSMKRYRVSSAALLAAVTTLGIGLATSSWQTLPGALEIGHGPHRGIAAASPLASEEHAAHEAKSLLVQDLIASGRLGEATELLRKRLGGLGPGSPRQVAEDLLLLGRTKESLGQLEGAYDAIDHAYDLFLAHAGEAAEETISARILRIRLNAALGRQELARTEALETLGHIRVLHPPRRHLEALLLRTLDAESSDLREDTPHSEQGTS